MKWQPTFRQSTSDILHRRMSAKHSLAQALTREVRRGLIARPRSLSPWMFYDAEGSRLFERITTLPEYYPTRTERAILAGHADAIIIAAHERQIVAVARD